MFEASGVPRLLRRPRAAFGAVVAVAILTRFVGIAHQVWSDENKVVTPAATLRIQNVERPLFPGGARYPHVAYYLHGGIFWLIGSIFQAEEFDRVVVARVVTAGLSVLAVVLVVWLGRHLGGWSLGLLAGLYLAVFPLAAKYAHYAHVDTPAALLMLAATCTAVLLWERGNARWYVATGALTGLAFATQYYGVTIGAVFLLAHAGWFFRQPARWRALVRPAFFVGLLAIPVVFALTNPWKIIVWREALETYRGLALRAQGGDLGYTSPHLLWPLTTRSPDWGLPFTVSGLLWEATPLLLGLAVVGVIVAARRRDARFLLLIATNALVLYLALAGYVRLHAVKRFLPLTPLIALLAAYGTLYLPFLVLRVGSVLRPLRIPLLALTVGMGLWMVGAFDFAYARGATHPQAAAWAEKNLPKGSTILQHGPLRLLAPDETRHRILALREEYANFGRHDRRVADHRARPLREWLSEGVEYVAMDSRMVDRYYEPTSTRLFPEMTASYRAFYDEIRSRGTRVFLIEPKPWVRAGPRMEIYDVRSLREPGARVSPDSGFAISSTRIPRSAPTGAGGR